MGYPNLTNFEDQLKDESDIDSLALKRLPFIQHLVDDFLKFSRDKYGVEILTIDDIAEYLSYAYFTLCYENIKPVINNNTNKYKMASLMELIIVKKQVLNCAPYTEMQNRELNAVFGMTAALSLINCMITDAKTEFFCNTGNNAINERIQKMLDDHKLWLKTKNPNELPIFINAQFYELIEIVHCSPLQLNGF